MWPLKKKEKKPEMGYRFKPLEDITAFELATIMRNGAWPSKEAIENLPTNVRRHYEYVEWK
jgi:hypothetical protein